MIPCAKGETEPTVRLRIIQIPGKLFTTCARNYRPGSLMFSMFNGSCWIVYSQRASSVRCRCFMVVVPVMVVGAAAA